MTWTQLSFVFAEPGELWIEIGPPGPVRHTSSCPEMERKGYLCNGFFVCPACGEAFGWCVDADPITDPEESDGRCRH